MREDIIYGIIGETLRGQGSGLRLWLLLLRLTFHGCPASCLCLE